MSYILKTTYLEIIISIFTIVFTMILRGLLLNLPGFFLLEKYKKKRYDQFINVQKRLSLYKHTRIKKKLKTDMKKTFNKHVGGSPQPPCQ
jgi:hypothetical protein